jgi:hypothetical protein
MAIITNPVTSGPRDRATDPEALTRAAEEPATMGAPIEAHRPNGGHTGKTGNGKSTGPFAMPPVWERTQTGPSAPGADQSSRPITTGDVFRWLGLARPAFGVLLAIVGVVGWISHSLWTGGWINRPVQETQLQAVVTKQDVMNTTIINRIDNMDNVLAAHSISLGQLMAASQDQSRLLARVEGFLSAGRLPASISASAPLQSPALSPMAPRKQKSKQKNTAWVAKPVVVN